MTDLRWLVDHVPNLLWAGDFVRDDPDGGLLRGANVLDAISGQLEALGIDLVQQGFLDGGLLAFEAIAEENRPQLTESLRLQGMWPTIVPDGLIHSLALYP